MPVHQSLNFPSKREFLGGRSPAIKKTRKTSLISGSQIVLNPKALGYSTLAFVGVFLEKAMNNPQAVEQLKKFLK